MCANVQHSAFTTTRHFLFQLLALLVKQQMLVLPNARGLLTKQTGSEIWYYFAYVTNSQGDRSALLSRYRNKNRSVSGFY